MDLFGGLSTPRWLTNEDIWNKPQAQSAGDLFLSGLAQGWQKANDQSNGSPKMSGDTSSANRSNPVPAWLAPWSKQSEQRSQENQQFDIQKNAALQHAALLDQNQQKQQLAAQIFQGVNFGDASQVTGVVSQHPWLAFDPATSKDTNEILKYSTESAKVANASVAAKIAADAGKKFYDELGKIPPIQANIIRGMGDPSNPTGPPNANQLAALNATKNTLNQQAIINALTRGQTSVETEVNAKGEVIQRYKTPPATQGSPEFQKSLEQSASVDLPDGSMMWRGAGSRQWYHLDKNTGTSKQLNDQQLQSMAKRFNESGDRNLKAKGAEIDDYLFNKFKGQSTKTAPSSSPAGSSTSKNEVIRTTPDGRKAIFDSQSKKFLRYAD